MREPAIIFEDSDLLVINKPARITVNRSETTKNMQTIQDWTEKELGIKNYELGIDQTTDFYNRGGIVHRLDKETSGLLIIAKTPEVFVAMQEQFKHRMVEKTYIALVHGEMMIPRDGEISLPVGRLPWNRKQFGIIAGGRESTTYYRTLALYQVKKTGEKVSLVQLSPKTGRTHQIRVHMKYARHPIFSDFLYAGRKISRIDRTLLNRVFLHAETLSIKHPKTNEKLFFEAPLPSELSHFINSELVAIT